MISVLVIHQPSGQCASIATMRRPYPYDIHFSQISCVNALFHPIPQSAQSISLEKPVLLTNFELSPIARRSGYSIRRTNHETDEIHENQINVIAPRSAMGRWFARQGGRAARGATYGSAMVPTCSGRIR